MADPWIKPRAVISRDSKSADIFIEGPIDDILVAEFVFEKEIIKFYSHVTPHLLLSIHTLYERLYKLYNKGGLNESKSSNKDS